MNKPLDIFGPGQYETSLPPGTEHLCGTCETCGDEIVQIVEVREKYGNESYYGFSKPKHRHKSCTDFLSKRIRQLEEKINGK